MAFVCVCFGKLPMLVLPLKQPTLASYTLHLHNTSFFDKQWLQWLQLHHNGYSHVLVWLHSQFRNCSMVSHMWCFGKVLTYFSLGCHWLSGLDESSEAICSASPMHLGHLLPEFCKFLPMFGRPDQLTSFTHQCDCHGILNLFPQHFALPLRVHFALSLPKQSYFCSADNGVAATYRALENTLPACFVYQRQRCGLLCFYNEMLRTSIAWISSSLHSLSSLDLVLRPHAPLSRAHSLLVSHASVLVSVA